MNCKSIIYFLVFLLLVPGVHILFSHFGWAGRHIIPIAIPWLYGCLYFGISVSFLSKSKFKKALYSFVITALLASISLKFEYWHYNIALTALIMLVALFIMKFLRNDGVSGLVTTCLLLVLLNACLIPVSDSAILARLNYDSYAWSPNVSWEQFQAEPDSNSTYEAVIDEAFIWKINKVYNYPPAIILATMKPATSWKRHLKNATWSEELLQHEQTHLDITELYRRNAVDSILQLWGSKPKALENVILYFIVQKNLKQLEYDSLTAHGMVPVEQLVWTQLINEKITFSNTSYQNRGSK
jgi:hypothetical protein